MKVASAKIVPAEDMSKDLKSEKNVGLGSPMGGEGPGFTLTEIESLLGMLDKHDVSEFQLELEGSKIALKRGPAAAAAAPAQQAPQYPMPYPMFGPMPGYSPNYPPQNYGPQGYPQSPMPSQNPGAASDGTEDAAKPASTKPAIALKEISSPMVGTFYRRPAVDAEPYVNLGDPIKKGDVLCIIEAMKLMNEIESDFSGKIVEICLEDGQMVEYGEVLFRIEPA